MKKIFGNRYMPAYCSKEAEAKAQDCIKRGMHMPNRKLLRTQEQLNGILCLVEGNHDQFGRKKGYNAARFKWIRPYTELNDNKRKVVLCHYPILCYNGQYLRTEDGEPRTYMLYGHVHDTWDQRLMEQAQALSRQQERRRPDGTKYNLPCRMINCFCMYSDYTPLTLDEWIINDRERSALKN